MLTHTSAHTQTQVKKHTHSTVNGEMLCGIQKDLAFASSQRLQRSKLVLGDILYLTS